MRHVIVVELEIDPARFPRFMELMMENARASRKEEGCERFDVVVPKEGGARLHLFEVYRDEAAFLAHKQSPHYLAFVEKRGDMIRNARFGACNFVEEIAT